MRTINATAEQAEDTLVALAGHLPAEVPIGRPVIATGKDDGGVEVLADVDGEPLVWWVYPDRVQRLMPVGGGRCELVEWSHRVERSRVLGRTE